MSEPKLHHFVPQFLLRRFAVGDGDDARLELIKRDDLGRVIPSTVRKALAENHFYSLETENGRDATMEKILAELIEDPAAEAIRRLVDKGRSINAPGIRIPLSVFMAFQFLRGPAARRVVVDHHNATATAALSIMPPEYATKLAQEQGKDISLEDATEVLDLVKSGKIKLGFRSEANLHIGTFKHALDLAKFFGGRIWHLHEFDQPLLLTSDEPIGLVGANVHVPGEAVGLVNASAVVFPLDPWHGLVMLRADLTDAHDARFRSTPAEARIINHHVAFAAHRFIARRPGTDPLAGLVVPDKAPSVYSVQDMVASQPNASVAARSRFLDRLRRGEVQFGMPLGQDDEPEST